MVHEGWRSARRFCRGHRPDGYCGDREGHRRLKVWLPAEDHFPKRQSDLSGRRPERGDSSVKLCLGARTIALAAAALLPASLAFSQQKPADVAKARTAASPGK